MAADLIGTGWAIIILGMACLLARLLLKTPTLKLGLALITAGGVLVMTVVLVWALLIPNWAEAGMAAVALVSTGSLFVAISVYRTARRLQQELEQPQPPGRVEEQCPR
jgi:hypothetical protein